MYSDLTFLFLTENVILHMYVNKVNVNYCLEPTNMLPIIYCQCIISQTSSCEYGGVIVSLCVYICVYTHSILNIYSCMNIYLNEFGHDEMFSAEMPELSLEVTCPAPSARG